MGKNQINEYFLTIKEPVSETLIIKNSKFICYGFPINSVQQAESYIAQIKKKHYQATHVPYAFQLGVEKNVYRYYDDGEPSGTAGKPILTAIEKYDLTNVIFLVPRYFGGIKLGVSGLFHAYFDTVNQTILKSEIIQVPITKKLEFTLDYQTYNNLRHFIFTNLISPRETFSEQVTIDAEVPVSKFEQLIESLTNKSAGKIVFINK